jgi:hydroxymethylglutaryl-CoA reductase
VSDARISGLHKLALGERIDELGRRGWLSASDVQLLRHGRQVLLPVAADRMVENVLGVFGLPLAIAPNFVVNGRACIVPLVVEEPSVVAGLGAAAKLALPEGFAVQSDAALLAGQIHITGVADGSAAVAALQRCKAEILASADAAQPCLARHGGGARDIEVRLLDLPDGTVVVALHILIATGDAMGANIVNTICESLAPRVAEICGGDVALRILSNLADRSLVRAAVQYPLDALAVSGFAAELVRDRVVMASDIASADPYRAATHNKGIMNGIDALAIATGNDWRAIEAGAHAFAAMSGQYRPLARWTSATNGDLRGELCMPLRAAIVGGTAPVNPAALLGLRMTGVRSAQQLSELMAAVGLAQNFAALKALATRGIQDGHMRLHARHKTAPNATIAPLANPQGSAAGKVILLGEHAVVYGRHALALPIRRAVTASIVPAAAGIDPFYGKVVKVIRTELGLAGDEFGVDVRSILPAGMGLGSSAAIAVAITRAVSQSRALDLDDERINSIAYSCEKLAHGTPSGVDNVLATYAKPMLFSNAHGLRFDALELAATPPLIIAHSSQPGMTYAQVAGVRARHTLRPAHYDAIFDEIDALSLAGAIALQQADYAELGALMNICHGLLNALEVSTAEIESIVSLARSAGACGAKLTGGGGGGSVVILCPGAVDAVTAALAAAGIATLSLADSKEA